ncbi:MAG TPA: hypothetical protein VFA12_20355 [Stellaceae bacterium]|nr:hypothetical protein [Stellaceae bacterium]
MKALPASLTRPVAKAATSAQLVDELIEDIIRRHQLSGGTISPAHLVRLEAMREPWAGIVSRHLDAYDQRSA